MQIDLAGKIDSCFCSLDSNIAHSFNSLDDKLETKFKYLDEGVTCTRETLQVHHETLSSFSVMATCQKDSLTQTRSVVEYQ